MRTLDAPAWLVAPGSFFDDAEPVAAVERETGDTAAIVYTSGVTGEPKGAELEHENLFANARATADLFGFGEGDAVLAALPLAHAFGRPARSTPLLAGARLVLGDRFEAARRRQRAGRRAVDVRTAARGRRTGTPALRLCVSGGAPLAPELLDACEQTLGTRLLKGYGLTETSPVAPSTALGSAPARLDRHARRRRRDAAARRADGVGEIAVRGHNVMKGYWNRPEATRAVLSEDGWLRTGDLARVDDDGAFRIVGRSKDLIIRDGRNVHPREVEDVLHGHPEVVEAAVLGVADPLLGEEVVACVVVAPGATVTEDDLRDYARERTARYPRHVWLAPALPHSSTGKVLKRAIVIRPASRAGRSPPRERHARSAV